MMWKGWSGRACVDGTALAAMLGMMVALPRSVDARASGSNEASPTQFIWRVQYMEAFSSYTLETRNLSRGDTVMHLLRRNTDGSYTEVAYNDDKDASTYASQLTYFSYVSGHYAILVRSFTTGLWGNADLYVNNSRVRQQNQFGGIHSALYLDAGDELRIAGTRRGYGNDFMLFVFDGFSIKDYDDDDGPGLYPYLQTSVSGSRSVVWGMYPGDDGWGRLLQQSQRSGGQCWNSWTAPSGVVCLNDSDGDWISNDLERLLGTNTNRSDTDGDVVPDHMEVFGNDGWSFSEGGDPRRRNLYVEVDYMTGTSADSRNRVPSADFAARVSAKFGANSDIIATVIKDNAVPWHENISFEYATTDPSRCYNGTLLDCVPFDYVKSLWFSAYDPERRPYFHYAVFAYRVDGAETAGKAEGPGNDLIFASIDPDSQTETYKMEQRGAFLHELGHNLYILDHNGNDWPDPSKRSIVHYSVMNYRYDTVYDNYSHGQGKFGYRCEPCSNSPKNACEGLDSGDSACNTCDCDIDEWSMLDLDFYKCADDPRPCTGWSDGSSDDDTESVDAVDGGIRGVENAGGPDNNGSIEAPSKLAEAKKRAADPIGKARRVLDDGIDDRRKRVRAHVDQLEGRGLKRDVDFFVARDGTSVYMR